MNAFTFGSVKQNKKIFYPETKNSPISFLTVEWFRARIVRIAAFCSLEFRMAGVVVVSRHIRCIVLASKESTTTQLHIDLSNISPARDQKDVQRSTNHHHVDNPLLRPTEIQTLTKSLPDSTTQEHPILIGVNTVSLGTN